MKQKQIATFSSCLAAVITAGVLFSGCDKNNDIVIPPIGGYNNSDEVGAANLTGYWNLDGDGKESKSGANPTSLNRCFVWRHIFFKHSAFAHINRIVITACL